jgi:hypothetical protein
MRYRLNIAIQHGSDFSEPARESLLAEIGAQVAARHSGPVEALEIAVREQATVVVSATLGGADPHDLTSPLDALSRLDASVLRALAITGQFEEFDVVRRTLTARSAPDLGEFAVP